MSDIVESTIQDVIGCEPFSGSENFTLIQVTLKAWLMRQGWKTNALSVMTKTEFMQAYTDLHLAQELSTKYSMPPISEERGRRFAAAPYVPKTPSVINLIKRKQRMGILPIALDTNDGEGNGLSEEHVLELIRRHAAPPKPAEVTIKVASPDKVRTIKGTKHPKLPILTTAMAARMQNGWHLNVWIFGPTASGKTHSVEQVAEAMGLKFYCHGAMSMTHELMGYRDGNGHYHTTPFREAFEKGGVVLLDECDSWDPSVTLALNGALANGVTAFPDKMVCRHKDCIIVAAGNTVGAGATVEFVGRNRLDAAFMSRFPVKIEWPRDENVEKAISNNDAWVDRVRAARERAQENGIKHAIDPRHSQAGAALIAAGMTMDQAAELTYLAGLSEMQRRTVEGN